MPTFTFTSPEGKSYDVTGPEGATKEQAFGMLQKQLSTTSAAIPPPNVPGMKPAAPPAPEKPESFWDKALGAGQAVGSMAAGAVAGPVGQLAGAGYGLTHGYGTPQGVQRAGEVAQRVSGALTPTPSSPTGKRYLQNVGEAFDASKLAGMPIPEANVLSTLGGPALRTASQSVASSIPRNIKISPRGSVGAAATPEELMREQRAEALPVPIRLTQGQKTRGHEQQKFERETAKLPEGEPLRARFAEQNEKVIQNLDMFTDMTGANQGSLRGVGQVVDKALRGKMGKAKASIAGAYKKARDSGEMLEPVNISALRDYLSANTSAARNAPILATVKSEMSRLSKGRDSLTLNELEELRKTISKASNPLTADAKYGPEMRNLIDRSTEGKGGALYKTARRLNENYAKEFKDKVVISKLVKSKPNSTDRQVAMEDVFDHAIMRGSLDDVRAVRRTLQTAGDEGKQAWKELQGQTVRGIKDQITSGAARDIQGNPIVSPAKLNKIVLDLDADGKLDFIFGKKGAQQLRDLNDLAKDVYTSPPGTVNHSNTASVILGMLDTIVSGTLGLPLPVATVVNQARSRLRSRALTKKVTQALDEPIPPKP